MQVVFRVLMIKPRKTANQIFPSMFLCFINHLFLTVMIFNCISHKKAGIPVIARIPAFSLSKYFIARLMQII